MGLFLEPDSVKFIYIPILVLISHCLLTVLLWYVLKSGSINTLHMFLFFQIILAILGPLLFHVNFRIGLDISFSFLSKTA